MISIFSGSGKISLLCAIAGLWSKSKGEGEIVSPSTEHVYFLPQKPYVSLFVFEF
jgi:putative ATP-binding cassette transporter